MWLINVESMKLEEFTPPHLPKYAILSHTWGEDEVTFREFCDLESLELSQKKGGREKIRMTCELAADRDIPYAWVDTCCIDKSSSAELSEAINSMFEWYRLSAENLYVCRWFRRGWTLQELLAPTVLEFYDSEWNLRVLKSDPDAIEQLSRMTGIRQRVLQFTDRIWNTDVGERMSWASQRETTRLEDQAYCLFGIFQVNMPMLYGEGTRAFQRLQEEIIKNNHDMSIFCWEVNHTQPKYRGFLARSPAEFASYPDLTLSSRDHVLWSRQSLEDFSITNKGIRIHAEIVQISYGDQHMATLKCSIASFSNVILIPIRHYQDNVYVRANSRVIISQYNINTFDNKQIYLAKDIDDQKSHKVDISAKSSDARFIIVPPQAPFQLVREKQWPEASWNSNGYVSEYCDSASGLAKPTSHFVACATYKTAS
ncbi:hypothetical protein F4777DRAFT_582418 [Nemania sp. FL0916]|nr:hypothetical protein F4777DRAFT_582418 [Nemania sp. FL0916]